MREEEVQFANDAIMLKATMRLADLAALVAGQDEAPALLLASTLQALNRTMNAQEAIEQVKHWLGTLTIAEQDLERFH